MLGERLGVILSTDSVWDPGRVRRESHSHPPFLGLPSFLLPPRGSSCQPGSTNPGFLPGGTLLTPSRNGHTHVWAMLGPKGAGILRWREGSGRCWIWRGTRMKLQFRLSLEMGLWLDLRSEMTFLRLRSAPVAPIPSNPRQWLCPAFEMRTPTHCPQSSLHMTPRAYRTRLTRHHTPLSSLLHGTKCLPFIISRQSPYYVPSTVSDPKIAM